MRDAVPVWRETVKVPFGNNVAHFAAPPPVGGMVAAQMWGMLSGKDRFEDADAVGRLSLLADSAMLAYADRAQWMNADGSMRLSAADAAATARLTDLGGRLDKAKHLAKERLPAAPAARPENPFATGFVVLDRDGSAVSCSVTMNHPFGTGRVAPATGMVLAAQPGAGGRGADSLSPMLVINPNVKEFFFAGASSGGIAAPTSLISVAARTLLADEPLEQAIAAPRVHHGGEPDRTFHEAQLAADVVSALSSRGHTMTPADEIGRVNAIACVKGVPPHPESCAMKSDPRGAGLALSAD